MNAHLNSKQLMEIVAITLSAGELMLKHGADTEKVESSVKKLSLAFGCDVSNILLLSYEIYQQNPYK
jgi:uncharacterized membrane protein YjjP (DUF1212 family)